jgi:hypothetical protein
MATPIAKDLLLTSDTHDLAIIDYDLQFTDGKQLTVQKLKQTLWLFQGEWFLNNAVGMPYFDEVLIKNVSLSRIETLYIRAIQSIPEVLEILNLDVNLDNAKRVLSVNFTIRDNDGNIIDIEL